MQRYTRRSVLVSAAGTVFASGLGTAPNVPERASPAGQSCDRRLPRVPYAPLFCLAYITPDAPTQSGQEAMVARYPLAVVPQDDHEVYRSWRDRVRALNPRITFLCYQMVHEETTVPGPGHDELRKITHSWCQYPIGFQPYTEYGGQHHRLYDPRTAEFEHYFLRACAAVLKSYPYEGLFLDNCTVFPIASPIEAVRTEMRAALQAILIKLRAEFPDVLLVGNSSYKWNALNGEMNEARPAQLDEEFAPFPGHACPHMNMYQAVLRDAKDLGTLRKDMARVLALGAYYGANVESTHVLWFDEFDEVLEKYQKTPHSPTQRPGGAVPGAPPQ